MKFLVTGGAGYIGAITTRMLLDAGHQVVVLDTLEKGHREAVDDRARLVVGDVGDRGALAEAFAVFPSLGGGAGECDAVMHLAGYIEVAESQAEPGRYFENNVSRPLVMLQAMAERGVEAICFSSTAAVYGEPEEVPITEKSPTRPINAYGASKLMFEEQLEWFERLRGLRSVRFRYFNVAGAWPDGSLGEAHEPETHIVPRILQAMAAGREEFEVYGKDYPTEDGTCVRDYIHVMDLGLAHRLGLEWLAENSETATPDPGGAGVPAQSGAVFNLGNGQGFSNLEVVRTCAEVTGRDVRIELGPRRAGDPAVLVASSDRARRVLGWAPERSRLRQIIGDAWEWHRRHPRPSKPGGNDGGRP